MNFANFATGQQEYSGFVIFAIGRSSAPHRQPRSAASPLISQSGTFVSTLLTMISMRAYMNGRNVLSWRNMTLARAEDSNGLANAMRPNVSLSYQALI